MVEISDEEMSYMLVELFVKEIAEKGEKKEMGLDTMINAYFYTLQRIKKKKDELGLVERNVKNEEKLLGTEKGKAELSGFGAH